MSPLPKSAAARGQQVDLLSLWYVEYGTIVDSTLWLQIRRYGLEGTQFVSPRDPLSPMTDRSAAMVVLSVVLLNSANATSSTVSGPAPLALNRFSTAMASVVPPRLASATAASSAILSSGSNFDKSARDFCAPAMLMVKYRFIAPANRGRADASPRSAISSITLSSSTKFGTSSGFSGTSSGPGCSFDATYDINSGRLSPRTGIEQPFKIRKPLRPAIPIKDCGRDTLVILACKARLHTRKRVNACFRIRFTGRHYCSKNYVRIVYFPKIRNLNIDSHLSTANKSLLAFRRGHSIKRQHNVLLVRHCWRRSYGLFGYRLHWSLTVAKCW
jgi:hypothetical protein